MARRRKRDLEGEYGDMGGSRPSLERMAIDPELSAEDQRVVKRLQLQVDSTDPGAPLDPLGEYVGLDAWGRRIPTLRDRGFTPVVTERGRGTMDQRIDPGDPSPWVNPDNPLDYGNPNEAWRDPAVSDPPRRGWENGNFDPEVVEHTAQAKVARNPQLAMASGVRQNGIYRAIQRVPKQVKRGLFGKNGQALERDLRHGNME